VTEKCFVAGGYGDLAKKLGARIIDLNDAGERPGGRELVRNVELKDGLKEKILLDFKILLRCGLRYFRTGIEKS